MKQLTVDQQEMVIENIKLVGSVMQKYKSLILSIKSMSQEDVYQYLCEVLCKCIQKHDPSRGTLSTYFFVSAHSRLLMILRNERSDSHVLNHMHESLDQPISKEDDTSALYELIEDVTNVEKDEMEYQDLLSILEPIFLEYPDEVFYLINHSKGYTQSWFSEKLGCTRSIFSRRVSRVKKLLLTTLENSYR